MLPKGKFEWFSFSHCNLTDEHQSIFNDLSCIKKFPHIPSSIMSLQVLLQDQDIPPLKLAEKIKLEPFIATEVLKIAEYRRFSKSPKDKPIESIEHAIVYIGRKTLEEIVLTASIKSFKCKNNAYYPEIYWHEAFLTGTIAESLAKRFAPKTINTDEAFLAGCLANIGKVVQCFFMEEEFEKIFSLTKNTSEANSWRKAERRLSTVSHILLGEIAATIWGLPAYVRDAAAQHHTLPKVGRNKSIILTDVIVFANQLTHWLLLKPERIDDHILNSISSFFGLNKKSLDALVEDLLPLRIPKTKQAV